ncbi:YlaH-like family protein [Laceyella putida]|jgi:cell division protein FtsX|uniref:YlaH-like family protein n=1 Tax=Laceyella putida TaxID=110101 RepID=A0ABW2RMQ0_9BACL
MEAIQSWLGSLSPWMTYLLILVLAAVVYKVAFAIRLPLLKQAVVYLALAVGCLLLTLFHYMGFPIVPILFFTVVLIAVTRIRLHFFRKQN